LPEVKSSDADTGPETSCFFGSLGKLPPLFWHANSAVASAVVVIVIVTLSPRPAILKSTASWPAASGPDALALVKCGLSAKAGPADRPTAATAATPIAPT
jgi:hypothetical protein